MNKSSELVAMLDEAAWRMLADLPRARRSEVVHRAMAEVALRLQRKSEDRLPPAQPRPVIDEAAAPTLRVVQEPHCTSRAAGQSARRQESA